MERISKPAAERNGSKGFSRKEQFGREKGAAVESISKPNAKGNDSCGFSSKEPFGREKRAAMESGIIKPIAERNGSYDKEKESSRRSVWATVRMQMKSVRSTLMKSSSTSSSSSSSSSADVVGYSDGCDDDGVDRELHRLLSDCLNFYDSSLSSQLFLHERLVGGRSSPLEGAFMWLGGWRPTSASVLVCSVLGGASQRTASNSAAGKEERSSQLSEEQVSYIHNLQKHTKQAEQELSSQLALFQMLLTDQSMVKAFGSEAAINECNHSAAQEAIQSKRENLQELLKNAETLRLQTLRALFNVLTPVQAARCSLAAFELIYALKALGKRHSGNKWKVHQET